MDLAYDLHDPEGGDDGKCPIILIHGWFWNRKGFSQIAKQMSSSLGRKVYNIDMRGHGESKESEKEITKENNVKDFSRFLETHNIQKASFVCHSLACVLAHMFAVSEPSKVEKIIMLDHHPYRPLEQVEKKRVADQYKMQCRFLSNLNPHLSLQEAKSKFLQQPCNTKGQQAFMKKLADEITKVNGKFQWNVDLEYLFDRGYSEELMRLPSPDEIYEGPILIIRAKDSALVTDSMFEEVLKLNPNCKLVTSSTSSHMIAHEDPEGLIKEADQFLNYD